jgi:hypothetical protein
LLPDIGYIFRGATVATLPRMRHSGEGVWGFLVKLFHPVAGCIANTLVVAAVGAAPAGDDFPLTGSYTQNVPCKGDGSDPADFKVKISPQRIDSSVGVCFFLDTKRSGSSIKAQVECQFTAGPLMGDITFTIRPDKTIEFIDRDRTYSALLYRCPE